MINFKNNVQPCGCEGEARGQVGKVSWREVGEAGQQHTEGRT